MPANPNAPFGFKYVGQVSGTVPNFGMRRGIIANANSNKMFTGDVLLAYSSGFLDVVTSSAQAAVGGVAVFFEWISKTQNKTVRSNYWNGGGTAEASGDIAVYYHADPFAVFQVQCKSGPVNEADVGLTINLDIGAGGQTVGTGNLSSFTVDDANMDTTTTRPFKIYRLPVDSNGPIPLMYAQPGLDPSQKFNQVFVTFNNLTS